MVDLPKKKVGIVACSGEELAEGSVTRLAALKVLEQLRPQDTVTICLPLFLAGGEGDRAFARFYPTIAVDGCDLRCAARGTEMYSGKPAASLVVSDLVRAEGLPPPSGTRRLDAAGQKAVEATARRITELVDDLLDRPWSRRAEAASAPVAVDLTLEIPVIQEEVQATCACGSGIPIQQVTVNDSAVTLVGLPLIFQQFQTAGKPPCADVALELLDTVKIYNPLPADEDAACADAILREYGAYCEKQAAQ